MKIEDIVTLIQAVSENGLTSFEFQEGDQKLVLKKKKKKKVAAPMVFSQPSAAPMAMPSMASPEPVAAPVTEASLEKAGFESDNVVVSPLVGTFYSASSPEAEAFAKVGDTVKKGQVLGIIEAMKLMNEIESDFDGVIEAVLVKNEAVVEFGQPLFRIR